MDDYDEDDGEVTMPSYRWSWYGLGTDVCSLASRVCDGFAQFFQSTGYNFARAHNLQVDEFTEGADRKQFVASFMEGLDDL